MRDGTISKASKLRDHCGIPSHSQHEDETALTLMKESLQKYGKSNHNGIPRILTVSYEGLMQFQGVYLMDIYKQLGISSSYLPAFEDGNEKYVKTMEDPAELLKKMRSRASILPKKVISVFGPESSGTTFLSQTFGIAVGAIQYLGDDAQPVHRQSATSDGEWEIQHLSLPWGWECEEGKDINVVEALVPEACFRYARDPSLEPRR